jgi:hypothetical protein
MTEQQIKDWKHERDLARAISNEEDRNAALQECYDHRDEMMMTCIAHQSARVKLIMKDHDDMVRSHKAFQQMLAQEKGEKEAYAKILNILKWMVALGGSGGIGAAIAKFAGGC